MIDASERLRRLVDELEGGGWLASEWRRSFLAVPRQQFIPETVWQLEGGDFRPVSRAEDPHRWLELASGERAVITQLDDGRVDNVGDMSTSSASMPKLVAEMLDHLDVQGGERVLEIGTGTGWNAALLAHRLGSDRVTSIEVDAEVAGHARKALSDAGFGGVTVVTGDGALGYPPHAPFDRLIATVAARRVPYEWVSQTRPGGRIVLPLDFDYIGLLAALTVADDGTASGYVFDHAAFMLLRDQRGTRGFSSTDEQDEQASITETSVHPSEVANPHHRLGSVIAIGSRVGRCRMAYYPPAQLDDHDGIIWMADDDSGSWARLHHDPASDGPHVVYQHGPRRLWDEVESAHRWWVEQGEPGADRWRLTVTPEGQRIELAGDQGP